MRVAFACVKKTRLHASTANAYTRTVYASAYNTFFHTYWLKFSNVAPMMALQLYSEHRRFSDYSNHVTIIYLRQIVIRNFQIFFPTVSISSPATKLTIVSNYEFRVVIAMYFESLLLALKSAIHVS